MRQEAVTVWRMGGEFYAERRQVLRCYPRPAINRIRSSKWSDNTLLVVASDHLALPNRARQMLQQGRRRNLLWIFPPDGEARTVAKPGQR